MDLVLKTVLVKAGVAIVTAFASAALTKAATDAFLTDNDKPEITGEPNNPSTKK